MGLVCTIQLNKINNQPNGGLNGKFDCNKVLQNYVHPPQTLTYYIPVQVVCLSAAIDKILGQIRKYAGYNRNTYTVN